MKSRVIIDWLTLSTQRTALFIDPSLNPAAAGWPLRNFLTLLASRYHARRMKVICWRDEIDGDVPSKSLIVDVFLPEPSKQDQRVHRNGCEPTAFEELIALNAG